MTPVQFQLFAIASFLIILAGAKSQSSALDHLTDTEGLSTTGCDPIYEQKSCSSIKGASKCDRKTDFMCQWDYNNMVCECYPDPPKQELVIAMDTSNSLKRTGWRDERDFVVSMIESSLGNDTRVGIVTFEARSKIMYRFTDSQLRSDLVDFVANMTNPPGGEVGTATLRALKNAIEVFEEYHLEGEPRVLFLITDGKPYPDGQNPCDANNSRAVEILQRLEALEVTVIVIGVGHQWNAMILECLVNDKEKQIFHAESFNRVVLQEIRGELDGFFCEAWVTEYQPCPGTTECVDKINWFGCGDMKTKEECTTGRAGEVPCVWRRNECICSEEPVQQIVWALDTSNSIKQEGWKQEKAFVIDLIDNVLSKDSYMGVVTFEDRSEIQYRLTESQNKSLLTHFIKNIENPIGDDIGTFTLAALQDAIKLFEEASHLHLPRVIYMVTDGLPYPAREQDPCTEFRDPVPGAFEMHKRLLELDIEVIVVGLGDKWDPLLACLVENPDTHIMYADSFSAADLDTIQGDLESLQCAQWSVIDPCEESYDPVASIPSPAPTTSQPTPPVVAPTQNPTIFRKNPCGGTFDECEHTYAYSEGASQCLLEILPGEARWGWAIDISEDNVPISGDIWAGAKMCDFCKGSVIGSFSVERVVTLDNLKEKKRYCNVTVSVSMDPGTSIDKFAWNVGKFPYVVKKRKNSRRSTETVAPNAYQHKMSLGGGGVDDLEWSSTFETKCMDAEYLLLYSHACPQSVKLDSGTDILSVQVPMNNNKLNVSPRQICFIALAIFLSLIAVVISWKAFVTWLYRHQISESTPLLTNLKTGSDKYATRPFDSYQTIPK